LKQPVTSLYLRNVPLGDAERFRRGARARGMTQAKYLSALCRLHDAVRARADAGDGELQAKLHALGLESIEV